MQVMAGMVVLGFMWDIVGYSLTFGTDHGGVIGDFKHAFLLGVGYNECSPHAPQIPAALYALFMMMFAAITPLLMTGAYVPGPGRRSSHASSRANPAPLQVLLLSESTGTHS